MPVEISLLVDLQRVLFEVERIRRQTEQLAEAESEKKQRQENQTVVIGIAAAVQLLESIELDDRILFLLSPDFVISELIEQKYGVESVSVMGFDP